MKRVVGRIVLAAFGAVACSAMGADFAGGGVGPIPDNNPVGRDITFNVSGNVGGIGTVVLRLGLQHSWSGDLVATLRSPGNGAKLLVFGRVGVGASTFGASSNFNGVYEFSDRGRDLWAVAVPLDSAQDVPAGRYRTSGLGVSGTAHGGCTTSLAGAFEGLVGSQVNGTWTLTIADLGGGDTGTISSAVLSISEAGDDLFGNGFDTPILGACQRVRSDYTGSGRSSYVVVRNTGGGAGGAVTWFVKDNDGTASGAVTNFVLGVSSDYFIDGDFEGDGIADAVVWTPATGQFTIRRSSRPGLAPLKIALGQSGDDPKHIGDFDGDGIDDLAVYRAGATQGALSRTWIRLSSSGAVRELATGEQGAYPNGGIDYTGDGRADMAIQANAGGGVASFRIYDGTSGAIASSFTFGSPTDVMVLGNHVGDARGDITLIRGSAGNITWTTRDGSTGIGHPAVVLGQSATDYALSGDFDGDGLDDYAAWRPSAVTGQSKFMIRRSRTPSSPPLEVFHGQSGDYPVANARTH